MQWLIDIIKAWVHNEGFATQVWVGAQGYLNDGYIDRGNYVGNDFENGDFTIDNAWHELDLSALIPEGTKAVVLRCVSHCDVVGWIYRLRPHGTTTNFNTSVSTIQVAGIKVTPTPTIGVSADRKIDYRFAPAANLAISLTVRGWFF